jgi:hypothetical protein
MRDQIRRTEIIKRLLEIENFFAGEITLAHVHDNWADASEEDVAHLRELAINFTQEGKKFGKERKELVEEYLLLL